MSIKKKALDPEIDLIAFISLLSVCICFLLLTSIWVQIGSMNFKQSIGGASGPSQPQPQLVIDFQDKGGLSLKVENFPKNFDRKLRSLVVGSEEGRPGVGQLRLFVEKVKVAVPNLNTAFLSPRPGTSYEDIVLTMDALRENGLNDLGITPL